MKGNAGGCFGAQINGNGAIGVGDQLTGDLTPEDHGRHGLRSGLAVCGRALIARPEAVS
jgi:hypothetical protein